MLIALNVIIAALIVAGIVGVIAHASRASYAADIARTKQVVQPRRAQTEHAGSPRTAGRGYRTVSPSRG
jgi:hypothetical protein